MQFVEKNSFNVRSTVYLMRNADSATEFLLFSMVHIGSLDFYERVTERLTKCDLILMEGVDSKRVNALTLSYRFIRFIKRMDLVTQNEALDIRQFKAKMRSADIKGEHFDKSWRSQSLWFRLLIFLTVPVWVVYLALFGTRRIIAKHLAVEDLESSDEILLRDEDTERLDDILLKDRDQIIIGQISNLIEEDGDEKRRVAVVFGAFHMRNIVKYLYEKRGYRITNSEWLTVFDL